MSGSILLLAGCHSRYVETTIANRTSGRLTVLQVEYPSASFGVQALDPGQSFHYRFKLYGSGPIKLSYFDARAVEHHQIGPLMNEGQEGTLSIDFSAQEHADFHVSLRDR